MTDLQACPELNGTNEVFFELNGAKEVFFELNGAKEVFSERIGANEDWLVGQKTKAFESKTIRGLSCYRQLYVIQSFSVQIIQAVL